MIPRFMLFPVIALLVAAQPAAALESVEVLEADGGLNQHVWISPSPTPGYCYWELAETDGPFFHATNAEGLAEVVEEIDRLERSEITEVRYLEYEHHYAAFVSAALALVGTSALLSGTLLRRLP